MRETAPAASSSSAATHRAEASGFFSLVFLVSRTIGFCSAVATKPATTKGKTSHMAYLTKR
ncbi:MAG: hypothetical protein BWY37_02118 [Firmicutes bacterium ADurb.Bin262]|nr:MAG: hypothetical protein BWY37_02118 [Firmicutes bacterium ADurb.Bin262]